MKTNFFIDIILPLPLKQFFTYQVTPDVYEMIQPGYRVAVPFGNKAAYTGIVYTKHTNKPELYQAKSIHYVLDNYAIVTNIQLQFWEWMATYYMCSIGDVMKQALPSAFNINSDTLIKKNAIWDTLLLDQDENEQTIFSILQNQSSVAVSELKGNIEEKLIIKTVKKLLDKALISIEEVIHSNYTPKIVQYIRLHPALLTDESHLLAAFKEIEKAPKQKAIIMQLFALKHSEKPIKVSELLKTLNSNYSVLVALEKKQYIERYTLQVDRTLISEETINQLPELSIIQKSTYENIINNFTTQNIQLLHGITGSGKTEIYIHLIKKILDKHKKVTLLLPEIGLTNHLVYRIRKYFGKKVGVYHSKINDNERLELWLKTLYNQYDIVIGTRASLFLPMQEVGLVIVDEEHDSSFKQVDRNPRYNAKDAALMWAQINGAKSLLGSATPSIESYYHAQKGNYAYVQLNQRFSSVQLPIINLIDLKKAHKEKEIKGSFTFELIEAIESTIAENKQVIIFQNRRGFSPIVECQSCGFIPQCPNCDVSLTYHQYSRSLKCHYCGHSQAMLKQCYSCNSTAINTKGVGTEQLELELIQLFPSLQIERVDTDTMRKKYAFEKFMQRFEAKEIDIVVGTQILAKGIDFNHVGLVGVINADYMLHFPDFRAYERAYQLLVQVAGRAGRNESQGRVLIQTFQPEHDVLQQVTTYGYDLLAKNLLYDRKSFNYPPYNRLIAITLKHKNKEKLDTVAHVLAHQLKQSFGENLLGPEEPVVSRINNLYHQNILLKIGVKNKLPIAKKYIEEVIKSIQSITAYKSVTIAINVDP